LAVIDATVQAIKELDRRTKVLGERVSDRTVNDRQSQSQRRNGFVDMYGTEYQRQGDTQNPATFYISITPDLIYYERFEFKIAIQPFAIPISGGAVSNTSLSTNGTTITPNPHRHNLVPGISLVSSAVEDFEVWIEDINITPFLKAQFSGAWIDGEGVFPADNLRNYDLLEVIGHLYDWQKGAILTPGYKKVELKAKGTFNAILINYVKLSHVNR